MNITDSVAYGVSKSAMAGVDGGNTATNSASFQHQPVTHVYIMVKDLYAKQYYQAINKYTRSI